MATFSEFLRGAAGRLLLAGLCGLAAGGPAAGQTDSLASLTAKLARYAQRGPQEKLFLHLDRPLYLSGETMWFKVYAVAASTQQPLALSSVAYVEVLDAQRRPVLQAKVALQHATGQGSFVLPAALASGSYTVRAYTSWMQNFGPETYFHGPVTVLNTAGASGAAPGRDSVAVDAQFFPEGGGLVLGLPSRVGFKVTGRTGQGLAAKGQVLDPAGQVVATFSTLRLGMGSFLLTPTTAQGAYTAVLTLGSHRVVRRPLPPVRAQGYGLQVAASSATQLTLVARATSQQPETVYLLAHAHQQAAVAMQGQLLQGQVSFVVDKSRLPEGVSHFTLFSARQQPLCERLYFRAPAHLLALTAQADKPSYGPRANVQVQVAAASQPGATLSMAVYRLDSLNTTPATTIEQALWLTSELRGPVEDPGYYFTATGPAAAEATDNLLLTQGWSQFRWEEVLAATLPPFTYLPEPYGPVVRARLTQAGTGRPQPGVLAYLASPSRITRLSNAMSDANGLLQFELPDFVGTRELVVQTDPQQDSTSQLVLLNPFSARYAEAGAAPFQLAPRFQRDYARRHVQSQVQRAYAGPSRFAALPTDSVAFYGKPTETYLLDKFVRFKSLEEVLREYVPGVLVKIRKDGFHLMVVDQAHKTLSLLKENPLVLLDGVPLFNINKVMAISPLKLQKLEVIDARYFHGLALYNGLVSFTSYRGDLAGVPLDPRVLVQRYEGVQQQRAFYAPRYETPQDQQSRLPDLRNLLYWNPSISPTGAAGRTLTFYTGDQAGHYLVVVQGLAANGLAGSTHLTLEVKAPL